jgi:hypothetical protein
MSLDPTDGSAAERSSPLEQEQARSSLARLRMLLFEEGGLMRSLVAESPSEGLAGSGGHRDASGSHRGSIDPPEPLGQPPLSPAQLVATGPRVDGHAADYELLVEAIYEGYLLHYRTPRIVRPAEEDLGLLAGDRLYALGLARLVKLGDIEAVAELADVITLSALAHAGDRPDLADAVWMAGARAVGWGPSPHHERAKALLRAGSPEALEALHSSPPA